MSKLPSGFWVLVVTTLTAVLPPLINSFTETVPTEWQWVWAIVVTMLFTGLKALQEAMDQRQARKLSRDIGAAPVSSWKTGEFWRVVVWGEKR